MMKPSVFFYNIGQGFKGVFRNRVMTTASVLVLVACMILVGTFYLVIDTIDKGFKAIDSLNVIEIMLNKDYDQKQMLDIGEQISDICEKSGIIDWSGDRWSNRELPPTKDENDQSTWSFYFVSDDEHLEIMRDQYGSVIDEIFEHDHVHGGGEGEPSGWGNTVEGNPLRSSFRVTFVNFSDIDEVRKVKTEIDGIEIVDPRGETIDAIATEDIKDYLDLYENVMGLKNTLSIVGVWLMIIFLIIALFVIMNTIKLGVYARRHEITFMRLCGATKGFIRMPFVVEGIIIGIFSALVSFGLEFALYEFLLKDFVISAMGSGTTEGWILSFMDYAPAIGIGFAAIGLFAGIVSSSISLKKYLKA